MNAVPALDPALYPVFWTDAEREALVLQYLPQVHRVARRVAATLPGHIALTDLIGAGVLGLIDAVRRFDPAHDTRLNTYAQFRIRGAIMDSLRSQDWGPRRLRLLARRIADARHDLSLSLHRMPSESEIAVHIGSSLQEYQRQLIQVRGLEVVSFVDAPEEEGVSGLAVEDVPSPGPSPLQTLLGDERNGRLAAAVEALPSRERQVVALYYLEELTMREVGGVMGVSESRVCQLHGSALSRLRKILA